MPKDVFNCSDYKRINLPDLTPEEVTALTLLGRKAFGDPSFDSLRQTGEQRGSQTVHWCTYEDKSGCVVVDNSLRGEGIFYLELVVAHPPSGGMGTVLHKTVFADLAKREEKGVVLVLTQNPGEITSFVKAANILGYHCFPIDREPNSEERASVRKWINLGPMGRTGFSPKVDENCCIVHEAFRNWQPEVNSQVKEGKLLDFLHKNGINFSKFYIEKSAFIVGFTL